MVKLGLTKENLLLPGLRSDLLSPFIEESTSETASGHLAEDQSGKESRTIVHRPDLPTITHWAWMYNLLKHPRTLEFNPRIHLIGYISVAVDSLVPERVPSSSRTPGYEATLLTV